MIVTNKIEPLCPIFGECGGCDYQDLAYDEELRTKESRLRSLFKEKCAIPAERFEPILASPLEYGYRNRLDMKLVRSKTGEADIGFSPLGRNRLIPAQACAIARREISDFLPELKRQALSRLTSKYRMANLVVRCGDEGRVVWGGIGRRSLSLNEPDYLWTEIHGKKIFYSLDTFFQANLAILPSAVERILQLPVWQERPIFFDLYGGVGLFSFSVMERVRRIVLIEENPASVKIARFNKNHRLPDNMDILAGRVEDELPRLLPFSDGERRVALLDPPRAGLSPQALAMLTAAKGFDFILYLSCHPDSLLRDLERFTVEGWTIFKILPFDFFPKTRHLETLVVLHPATKGPDEN